MEDLILNIGSVAAAKLLPSNKSYDVYGCWSAMHCIHMTLQHSAIILRYTISQNIN